MYCAQDTDFTVLSDSTPSHLSRFDVATVVTVNAVTRL